MRNQLLKIGYKFFLSFQLSLRSKKFLHWRHHSWIIRQRVQIELDNININIATFIVGGWEWDTTQDALGEVLQWDTHFNHWMLISYITPRFFHSVSILPCDEIKNYCTSTTKKNSFPKRDHVGMKNKDGSI